MKLWHISQTVNNYYDTYDSAVVAAESEEIARTIHPSPFVTHYRDGKWYVTYSVKSGDEYEQDGREDWVEANALHLIIVRYLGEAVEGMKQGVICSSFHAG